MENSKTKTETLNWDKLPKDLDSYGLNSPRENANAQLNRKTIAEVVKYVKANFKPIKSINKERNSIDINKHVTKALKAEHGAYYISNGELIAGMILSGYKHQLVDDKSPVCYFNVSQTSFE